MPVQPPLQSRDRQPRDAVAQRGNFFHLHLALGADEENLHLIAETPFQGLGDSHGRIDMASGSTSGKNDAFHGIIFLILNFSFFIEFTADGRKLIVPSCPGPATGS